MCYNQISIVLLYFTTVSAKHLTTASNNYMELKTALLWIHVVLELFGIVGHVLSIVVLAERTLRSSTSLYLTMMSLFNCLFLMTTLYGDVDDALTSYKTVPRSVLNSIRVIIGACSVYTTVVVTIERYIAVAYPLKAHVLCTVTLSWKIILIIVFMSVGFGSLRSIKMFAATANNSTDITINCYQHVNAHYKSMYCLLSAAVLLLIVPYFIFLVFNIRILQILSHRNHNIVTGTGISGHNGDVWIGVTLGITFCFLICCTFPGIVYIVDEIDIEIFNYRRDIVRRVCNTLIDVNFSTNFVFYCFFGKNFRGIFMAKFCGCKRTEPVYS